MNKERNNYLDIKNEQNTILFNILVRKTNPKKIIRYNVLEIGCGYGHFARSMCMFFRKYDAVDINTERIDNAKKLTHPIYSNLTFFVDNILNLSTQNIQYKIIFALHAIHYIGNLEILFENIYKLLQKNGKLIIVENKPEPVRWGDSRLNIESDKFNEKIWMDKKKQLDDTHNYILKKCDMVYIEGNYYRYYVIKNITR